MPCNCHGAHVCGGQQYNFPCNQIPTSNLTIELPDSNTPHILSMDRSIQKQNLPDTLLIDLGTTTIAMVFYSSKKNTIYHNEIFVNPQTNYGADVMSRIQFSLMPHNEKILTEQIRQALASHYKKVCERFPNINIERCFIGGNTTMIHLLMGYSAEGLATSPFTPYSSPNNSVMYQTTPVTILPWLSAFVGGDIVAGLLKYHYDSRQDTSLFVDLGTNGELALIQKGHIYTTSTSAGPVFEGASLTHGCAAISGAISDIKLGGVIPKLTTLDNKLPIGICGSGAISLLAELLDKQYLTKEGVLTEKFPETGLILCKKQDGTAILITPQDVRKIQLGVAAIAAGIDSLCHVAGIQSTAVDNLFLAGGFGTHLSLDKIHLTGLFSQVPKSSIHLVGNSCLAGLALATSENYNWKMHFEKIVHNNETVILANDSYFQQSFIQHMSYESH